MASMVAKGSSNCSTQVSPSITVQEKGTEKFEITQGHGQIGVCDLCSVNKDHSDGLKLDLGLSSTVGSSEVGPSRPREELEADEFQDADWSDLTETQLEDLVLSNLDTIFKSAIKKIVACGYAEEVATKAVLRSGLCYGCKDTVSNIVDNTLIFLRSGQEIDPSREHCFEDLQQLEKYILAELVCVLREVRPFFSTGDAMWCLLICDMNVSHACAMDGDPLNSFMSDGASNGSSSMPNQPQSKIEAKSVELNLLSPSKPVPSIPGSHCSQYETPAIAGGVSNIAKPKNSLVQSGSFSEKEITNSTSHNGDKSFGVSGTSQSPAVEEKLLGSRKVHSVSTKREYMLRQKPLHLEKNYRTYGCKGSSRAGKLSGLGGLILDKKLKSVSDSTAVNLKNASLKISKAMGVDVPQENGNHNLSSNTGPSSPRAFNLDADNTASVLPQNNVPSILPAVNTSNPLPAVSTSTALPAVNSSTPLPVANTPPALSVADTELSLSLPTKSNSSSVSLSCKSDATNSIFSGIPYDKSSGQWVPRDKKDEMILKLVPRVRDLQNQLQEWTEWANQKVMQAARRLSKDKAELKSLRQEKEEVERLKKEKQTLEENTMKKLSEMENALRKASGQVERANSAVRRLEVENAALRQEMEAAKVRAAESAASCQEVSKRERKTLMKIQSWEKQKVLLNEELVTEKRKFKQLLQEVEQAKDLQEQLEVLVLSFFSLKRKVCRRLDGSRRRNQKMNYLSRPVQ
ncbi:putative E3 ubiquitin-protein ligase RF298 isoform X2 [Prunus yedoensis var. nudiflora]|uniref:Putative E3 ubiquitin-protein ligase RF298 isoform X2 n=1 Tax=Prunus yedoensis var. nudiflora TaxID=2094558 RepID=A0A314Y510_PRUYE|nr:putative E3 ubiquitin-protein ligase RF298 isoform X2 [Prunus yedoensis var. nudiflora]